MGGWLYVYAVGMFGSWIGLLVGGPGGSLRYTYEKIWMLCAVLGGFVVGNNLPAPWPKRIHPMLTSMALTYTATVLWSACSGSVFLQVLNFFKGPKGAGGGLLLPMLQPLLLSLGFSLYERRTVLKKNLIPVLGTTFGSALFGLFFSAILAGPILHLPVILAGSAVPRCVTAALALAIASMLGSTLCNPAFAIALVQVMGLIGAAQGLNVMKKMGFTTPLQRGLSMGATSAGLGTVAIARVDPEAFGYSSVSFALCGAWATVLVTIPQVRAALVKILLMA